MALLRNSIVVVLFCLCASFTVYHHGWADYDQEKALDYTGTVQEFTVVNPHAIAKVKEGKKTWTVVLAPTSRMQERGVPTDKLVKGNQVRVVGYPHKEVKDEMRAERIFIGNQKYELRR